MADIALTWQRMDDTGLEQVKVWLGAGLTLIACGSLCHEGTTTRLNYRMSTNRKGWVSHAMIEIETPNKTLLKLQRRADGRWLVNGMERPEFDGCSEFGLQCGGLTNAFPIRRLKLAEGESRELEVLFIGLPELTLKTCRQSYTRLPDQNGQARYLYRSPGSSAEIQVDAYGLTELYRGLLRRIPCAERAFC